MPKIAGHIYKARQSYVLQRAVPSDVRQVVCKATWKEPGGKTLNEARARLPGFLARTDREIAIARGEVRLTVDEQIDRLPLTTDLKDPEMQELLLEGARIDPDLTQAQRERMAAVVTGDLIPDPVYTAEDLIAIATKLKQPAKRTRESWCKQLDLFMQFCGAGSPLSCTKDQAAAYRTHLLERVSPNTTKTTLNYLSGLWSILEEVKPGSHHIFKGLAKRIKVVRSDKDAEVFPIERWSGSIYVPVFKILYYTGCRLAEVAALRGEDIHDDYISVEWHEERSLKTANSVRDIPIHPKLAAVLQRFRGTTGYLWPRLKTVKQVDGVEVIRWGHNLSKPCKQITGLKPKDFRDRFVTVLRSLDFNQINIERLTGHSALTTNSTYGGMDWPKYVQMIHSIQ